LASTERASARIRALTPSDQLIIERGKPNMIVAHPGEVRIGSRSEPPAMTRSKAARKAAGGHQCCSRNGQQVRWRVAAAGGTYGGFGGAGFAINAAP